MLQVMTDEESVAWADDLISRVAEALFYACTAHPGTSIDALTQVLWTVNGQNWMGASDMARAKVRAKEKLSGKTTPRGSARQTETNPAGSPTEPQAGPGSHRPTKCQTHTAFESQSAGPG